MSQEAPKTIGELLILGTQRGILTPEQINVPRRSDRKGWESVRHNGEGSRTSFSSTDSYTLTIAMELERLALPRVVAIGWKHIGQEQPAIRTSPFADSRFIVVPAFDRVEPKFLEVETEFHFDLGEDALVLPVYTPRPDGNWPEDLLTGSAVMTVLHMSMDNAKQEEGLHHWQEYFGIFRGDLLIDAREAIGLQLSSYLY